MLSNTSAYDLFVRIKRDFCEKLHIKSSFFYGSLDFHSSFSKKEFLVVDLFMPIKEPSYLFLFFDTDAFYLQQFINLFVLWFHFIVYVFFEIHAVPLLVVHLFFGCAQFCL